MIKTMLEEVKPLVTNKNEIEYRNVSKLIASFENFAFAL